LVFYLAWLSEKSRPEARFDAAEKRSVGMSFAETWNIIFFFFMIVLCWLIRLPLKKRILVSVIGITGNVICVLTSLSAVLFPEEASLIIRDWLPLALILVAYHQAGQLFEKPWEKFQAFLMKLDQRLLGRYADPSGRTRLHPVLSAYLEVTYSVCYPLIPAALGALYLLNLRTRVESFWMVVLIPTYVCYALVPFLPAYPPRLLQAKTGDSVPSGKSRKFNLWILRYGSIHANTFPSAHVAACIAASLVICRDNIMVGIFFLWISLSIAVAVVLRRYHYLADAVLGIAISVMAFILLQ
jgi:hypothetical protein